MFLITYQQGLADNNVVCCQSIDALHRLLKQASCSRQHQELFGKSGTR